MVNQKKWKKDYPKKSFHELQKEIRKYADQAVEDIKKHINDPKDILELANFMSTFYRYSPKNMQLIRMQFPGATAVASAATFAKKGFYINKGEKSIRIFVPTPLKIFMLPDGTEKKLSEATELEKRQIEKGELTLRESMRYKLAPVFDLSQTQATAKDLPSLFPNRRYDFDFSAIDNPEGLKRVLEDIGAKMTVPVREMRDSQFGLKELGTTKGAYVEGTMPSGEVKKEIVMNSRFSLEEQIPTLIHELSHAGLHSREAMKNRESPLSKSTEEFQAELTSYIVCKHFGIDTSEEAIPYIANWTKNGEKIEDKVTTIEEVHELSRHFIVEIEKGLSSLELEIEKQKEQLNVSLLTTNDFSVGVKIGQVYYEGLENIEEQYEIELRDTETTAQYEEMEMLETNTFRVMVEKGGALSIYEAASDEWFVSEKVNHLFDTNSILEYCQKNHQGDATSGYIKYLEEEEVKKLPDSKEKSLEEPGKKKTSYQEGDAFEEEKQKAKSVDIVEFAERNGFTLKKEARDQYRDTTRSSLVFIPSKNRFYYNKEGIQGDTIAFAQQMLGITNFKEAIQYINEGEYGAVETKEVKNEPYTYNFSQEVIDFSKAREYLINKRKIDPDVIDSLHQKGLIRQDKRNNVLFLWNDKGNIAGCTEQGTVHNDNLPRGSWKKIQTNSTNGKGFNFKNGSPKNLKFFESSIDTLSYVSLHKENLKDTWFISMEGLKPGVVKNYVAEAYQITEGNIESVSLCVDNDKAGRQFVEKFERTGVQQKGKELVPFKAEYPEPPKEKDTNSWDWNNELVFRQEIKGKARKKQLSHSVEMEL